MNGQNIFPAMAMSNVDGASTVSLEGQKVLFDKKVSLLPADIKKEKSIVSTNGKPRR